jgi:nicotinate-nucleotide adenylyltransferase
VDVERLGVFGGTFDPPHYGHLVLAENARAQLALERVLFVVAGQQPLKSDDSVASARHRAAMVQAAIGDHAGFEISRVDLERAGPHYTVDTLLLLKQQHPDAELLFLVGGDSLAHLLAWRDPAGIASLARLAVMRRPGYTPDLEVLERAVPGIRERLIWLDAPLLAISATDLRRRVREGLPVRYLVPPSVEAYIQDNCLYTGECA